MNFTLVFALVVNPSLHKKVSEIEDFMGAVLSWMLARLGQASRRTPPTTHRRRCLCAVNAAEATATQP